MIEFLLIWLCFIGFFVGLHFWHEEQHKPKDIEEFVDVDKEDY